MAKGKPNPGTPADKRLKENQGKKGAFGGKKAAPYGAKK